MSARDTIARNVEEIGARISAAAARAGRDPQQIRLIAVTKTEGLEAIQALLELGLNNLAENRVEVAREKIAAIGNRARWRMIGSIQRRKAGDIAQLFDAIDSVDRFEVAETLDRKCAELGKVIPILLETNVSGELSKHGFTPADIPQALKQINALKNVRVEGLMTMAPFVEEPEEVRPVFAELKKLADELGLKELSMGMSNDFEIAIEEGATQVRIGTALFAS